MQRISANAVQPVRVNPLQRSDQPGVARIAEASQAKDASRQLREKRKVSAPAGVYYSSPPSTAHLTNTPSPRTHCDLTPTPSAPLGRRQRSDDRIPRIFLRRASHPPPIHNERRRINDDEPFVDEAARQQQAPPRAQGAHEVGHRSTRRTHQRRRIFFSQLSETGAEDSSHS